MRSAAGWRRYFPEDWFARIYVGWITSLALTSAALLIAAAVTGSSRVLASSGFFAFWFVFWLFPSLVTMWLCHRQRKIAVEEKLDVVIEGVGQVQEMLAGKTAKRPNLIGLDGGRK